MPTIACLAVRESDVGQSVNLFDGCRTAVWYKNLQFPDKHRVNQVGDTCRLDLHSYLVALDFLATNEVIFILMAQTTRPRTPSASSNRGGEQIFLLIP